MCLGLCSQLCVRVPLVCLGVGSSPTGMGPAYSLPVTCVWVPSARNI